MGFWGKLGLGMAMMAYDMHKQDEKERKEREQLEKEIDEAFDEIYDLIQESLDAVARLSKELVISIRKVAKESDYGQLLTGRINLLTAYAFYVALQNQISPISSTQESYIEAFFDREFDNYTSSDFMDSLKCENEFKSDMWSWFGVSEEYIGLYWTILLETTNKIENGIDYFLEILEIYTNIIIEFFSISMDIRTSIGDVISEFMKTLLLYIE